MRQISDVFAARLAADETSLCACWRFTRTDGAMFGATDHDRAIEFDGVTYEPASGLNGATFESSAGLAPGRAATEGAISADFIEDADLEAGLWDRATVDVWRVDWKAPEHRLRIWSGRLSEVTRQGASFNAELVSLKADLERLIGRVYARGCDAEIGDARCGFDLSQPEFRGEGEIAFLTGDRSFTASGVGGVVDGWFVGGAISWTSGANAGSTGRVVRHTGSEIQLVAAPRFVIAPGDAFIVTAGCDKSFAMCGGKFANRGNFRGFPHMPGPDAILAGPSSTNTGGSRL